MDGVNDKVAGSIRDAIDPDNRGLILTKWTVIAEVIDSTGTRGLVRLFDPDMGIWDAVGLLDVVAEELRHTFAAQEMIGLHGEDD